MLVGPTQCNSNHLLCLPIFIHKILDQPQKEPSTWGRIKAMYIPNLLQLCIQISKQQFTINQVINKSRARFRALQQQRTLRMFDLGQSNYLVQATSPKNSENNQLRQENRSFWGQTYLNCKLWTYEEEIKDEKKDGKWSLREIMRYYQFLLEFRPLFKSKQLRKTAKIFSLMAKHIRSRETSQCKSHHQKIQKYYGKIDEIIIHYTKILTPLKKQWQQFAKTENRVLINAFPQINRAQENYQIFEFKDCIRIYIKEQSVLRYEI